jgi:hypothetical protein
VQGVWSSCIVCAGMHGGVVTVHSVLACTGVWSTHLACTGVWPLCIVCAGMDRVWSACIVCAGMHRGVAIVYSCHE